MGCKCCNSDHKGWRRSDRWCTDPSLLRNRCMTNPPPITSLRCAFGPWEGSQKAYRRCPEFHRRRPGGCSCWVDSRRGGINWVRGLADVIAVAVAAAGVAILVVEVVGASLVIEIFDLVGRGSGKGPFAVAVD